MKEIMTASVLLDLKQAAARLGVCTKTLRGKIASGELRGIQLSKRMWRIDEADLQRYVDWRSTTVRSNEDSKSLRSFPKLSKSEKAG
jgi:excisionase family DNA binding protein